MTIRVLIADDQELDPHGLRDDPRAPTTDIEVVGEAERRRGGCRAGARAAARRGADGRPDAADGRRSRRRAQLAGGRRRRRADAHARSTSTSTSTGRCARARGLPAQGRAARDAWWRRCGSSTPARRCSRPSITRRLIEEFAAPQRPARAADAARSSTLTPREREVLRLGRARPLQRARSPSELVVTEATVKTHVGSVLIKLDLRDRVQAVVLVYEQGIVEPGAQRPIRL